MSRDTSKLILLWREMVVFVRLKTRQGKRAALGPPMATSGDLGISRSLILAVRRVSANIRVSNQSIGSVNRQEKTEWIPASAGTASIDLID
ncbi:hypothetical protein RRG08_039201 [Elysia crispata]|uniref:Uncharacterized protein n=1 Tax=Elysia crispata TaxID=231223 RepID=A0AAE1E4N3_9GAST|nr:hypothetical protein RRG08_039201 [Elysia crispata]